MILSYSLRNQRTSNFHNHHRSSFLCMDIHIRCYHSPSIHILHCCRCCLHCNRSCTSRIHHHMGCLMSIRNLRSKRTSNFHNHHHSSFLRMGIHIRCYHSPSIHILHCCRCCLHCNHSCTSRIHHHMGCLMSIHSLRSKRCSHHCIRIHCMGIHIRILCM